MIKELYYETGELRYRGEVAEEICQDNIEYASSGQGTSYYKNGNIMEQGEFCRRGLLKGKKYLETGELYFDGELSQERKTYYGPTYVVRGTIFRKDGSIAYSGEFKTEFQGSVGYPKTLRPDGMPEEDWVKLI